MTIAIITHPECNNHYTEFSHPETPARLIAINDALQNCQFRSSLIFYTAPIVEHQDIIRVHDPKYIEQLTILNSTQLNESYWIDADTYFMQHTLNAAFRAAGAATLAVDLVLNNQASAAFCAIRPPGHHAKRRQAMGFCFLNNVAIATAHAIAIYQLERIAIVDFDVHHGNGTENIVGGDARILLCSSFQHPFYPFEGADSKNENVCNLALPAGTDGTTYRAVVEEKWLPRLESFQPQLIVISAGFDGHALDGMSGFKLLEADYAWITNQIKHLANKYANGRIVSCLEGGYHLTALANSVVAHVAALL